MPTVLRQNGFRFFFYSNEHLPKHVHVEGKGGEVKIELESLTLINAFNLKKKDVRIILQIVNEQRFFFLKKWDEFYEQ
ncbi:DUF4160 domain-containing protein [Zunongwangia sp. F260]|jgi:uncharacterized protein YpmS|uniref:DUF4160 domain-containing protein n=1 Tax=Autumnicola lenta TaxID=3075593 RepID=A0ABU3CK30_9FLAO|nr:DUF4160 domain-containing protein [Zunongwangia sp. F260]MDT0646703.1 DUF4160 domain-containing protein [Zunongwangia sp. F260]